MTESGPARATRETALVAYQILPTLPEQAYDDIALLAAELCGTSIAAISFMTDTEQWFKARIGIADQVIPLSISLCTATLEQPEQVVVIPDAQANATFANNPLVLGAPHIRFYAGAALRTPEQLAIGTLCVADQAPRGLTARQQAALQALARQVESQLELRRTVQRLCASERRFEAFMDNSPVIAFMKNTAGQMTYVNQPYLQSFGFSADNVLGKTDQELWPPPLAARFAEQDRAALAGTDTLKTEEVVALPGVEPHFWKSYKFPLEVDGERVLAGLALDITENKRYEQQLEAYQYELERTLLQVEAESVTDGLTGIKNRRAFEVALALEIERAGLQGSAVALLLLDVDHFKQYNDAYGHPSGDEVLRTLGRALASAARASDTVARYGGEEFAVLLPHTGCDGAFVVAERVRKALAAIAWPNRAVTVSVGVAALDGAQVDATTLIKRADEALYTAKREGRDRIVVAVPEQHVIPIAARQEAALQL